MADRKISDLTALTAPASGDYLPIVDISEAAAASKNKRITIEELFRGVPSGTAAAPSIAIEGDEGTGVYSPGAYQLAISTNGTGRLFVDASGRVGINKSSPSQTLQVVSATGGTTARFENTSSGNFVDFYETTGGTRMGYIGHTSATDMYIHNDKAGPLVFDTNNTERLRITSAGLVGIGTTNPLNKLVVSHNNGAEGIEFLPGYTSNRNITFHYNRSGATYVQNDQIASAHVFRIASDSTQAAIIDSSGRLGVGTSSPQVLLHGQITSTASTNTEIFRLTDNALCDFRVFLDRGTALGNSTTRLKTANGILSFETSDTPRVTIDASGRVGIGTTSPSRALSIAGTLNCTTANGTLAEVVIDQTGQNAFSLQIPASTNRFAIKDLVANSERLVINSSGNVGIGTTSPACTLDVIGTAIRVVKSGDASNPRITLTPVSGNAQQITPYGDGDATECQLAFHAGTAGTEAARIDSSGRLLVGTTTAPTGSSSQYSKLVVRGNSLDNGGGYVAIGNGTAASSLTTGSDIANIYFIDGAGGQFGSIQCFADAAPGTGDNPGRLVFSTTADGASSPTERVRVDSAGRVMFSKAYNDTAKGCQIIPDDNNTGRFQSVGDGSSSGAAFYVTNASGTAQYIVRPNGNVLNVNNSYGAISDIKLKENIVNASSQWSDIKALQVRKYNFKEGQTHTQIGLIAQEVELVSPGLVSESPDRDAEGNDLGTVTKSVNYSVLYMKAVKALQEAMERIEQLETEMAAVKAQLS